MKQRDKTFPIQDSVPSRSVPVVTRALIRINALVFFFELALPQQSVVQIFYQFGIVPARYTHPELAAYVGFPVDNYWPILTHQFLHGDREACLTGKARTYFVKQ